MSRRTYKSILYHITFHTKNNQPFLTKEIEEKVFHFIFNKSKRFGLYLHRINGIENHIHMLLFIPPKYIVANIVGKLKGSSSYFINQELAVDDMLYWQRGYGVLTVSMQDFDRVYNYIKNQKEHHQNGELNDEMERINSEEDCISINEYTKIE
jgi:putative transposase